jgi:hypothetical protein
MLHAESRGRARRRALTLLLAGLLAGLFGLLSISAAAQDKGGADKKAEKKEKGDKKGAEKEVPWPKPLNLTVVSPSDAPETAEMVKLINDKLEAGWKANGVVPSRYVDDYEFIRRASLDIVGRIARPQEIQQYLKDPADKRRSLLINRLLDSEDYPRHWGDLWANWLLTRSGPFGRGKYHEQLALWLQDQFATASKDKPFSYADMVTKLITAKGKNSDNGAVNFILAHLGEPIGGGRRPNLARVREEGHFEMIPVTSRVTRLFLGTQVQCAQCHDHPFLGSLKQNHFWGVNAFLRQVNRPEPLAMQNNQMTTFPALSLVDDENVNEDAQVLYEKRNGVELFTKAEFLPAGEGKRGERLPAGTKGLARREKLAEYLVAHENFPRAIVNRMWGVFFGRGFVNPVDDFNDNNPPSNPELLTELAARYKHYNYDQKKLIRWMCNSNAYHLSCVANRTNDKPEQEALFGRMVLKAMSPEQLFESLIVATRYPEAGTAEGYKKLRDQWLSTLTTNFGDDEGNEVNFNGTVVQALLMMNGKDLDDAINNRQKGTLADAMSKRTAPAIINELYIAALNRPPTQREMTTILARVPLRPQYRGRDNVFAQVQDVFWALLNSNEFILNH